MEIELFAVANLVSKIEQGKLDPAPVWTDIKTFDAEPFRGKVHGITAGFPCQPFSVAGKQQGGYDPRHLWPHIAKHIRTIKPVFVCLENVPGLLQTRTLDNRPDLQRYITALGKTAKGLNAKDRWKLHQHQQRLRQFMLRTEGLQAFAAIYFGLRDMGYKVEAGLFTAAEVGAPHKRERLFILAYSERLGRRGWDNGEPAGQGRPLQTEGSGELAIADDQPRGAHTKERAGRTETRSAGETELADGERDGCGGVLRQTGCGTDRAQQRTNPDGQGARDGEQGAPCQLADTKDTERGRLPKKHARGRTSEAGRSDGMWPARPGQEQYEWEEPRTVKSGMGRTVDGFASRVDELRLLGNGVVPPTAELAFRALWEKFDRT